MHTIATERTRWSCSTPISNACTSLVFPPVLAAAIAVNITHRHHLSRHHTLPSPPHTQANRRLLADQVAHRDTGEVCTLLAELADRSHFSREDGWTEGDMYGVTVGWVNHMTSTSCGKNGLDCVWRAAQVTPYQVSITSEDFADWVEDVRAIMATAKGCPAFTITLRFVMESDAPMAMHSGRQVVSVELAAHGGRGATVPVRSGHLMEEILQMSLCKYEARPHWAHATNRLFTSPCPLRDTLGHDWDAFMEQRARYDPASLFTTPLFTAVANRGVGAMYPGCAVAGDCWWVVQGRGGLTCGAGGAAREQ